MKRISIIKHLIFTLSALVCITACDKNDDQDESVERQDIDLGLPSGTLWSNCNLGANTPWDFGNYYAWGEVTTKNEYYWGNYKYCDGSHETLTKYCNWSFHGKDNYCDTLTILQSEDDAATVILGLQYLTPTETDWKELCEHCYWVWTESYDNHKFASGYIVYKAKTANDKGTKIFSNKKASNSYTLADTHIFLPCAGYYKNSLVQGSHGLGYYWSATLDLYYTDYARFCLFHGYAVTPSEHDEVGSRCYGLSVRPVRHK